MSHSLFCHGFSEQLRAEGKVKRPDLITYLQKKTSTDDI